LITENLSRSWHSTLSSETDALLSNLHDWWANNKTNEHISVPLEIPAKGDAKEERKKERKKRNTGETNCNHAHIKPNIKQAKSTSAQSSSSILNCSHSNDQCALKLFSRRNILD